MTDCRCHDAAVLLRAELSADPLPSCPHSTEARAVELDEARIDVMRAAAAEMRAASRPAPHLCTCESLSHGMSRRLRGDPEPQPCGVHTPATGPQNASYGIGNDAALTAQLGAQIGAHITVNAHDNHQPLDAA